MFYSDELIQEVISANDIEDVISAYVRLKKSGRGSLGLCPFHNEKTPSFHVSADKQLYHCFGCGEGGTVINFIMKAENLDFVDALKFLAQRANITLPEPEQSPQMQKNLRKKQRMLSANTFAAKFFYNTLVKDPNAQKGRDYVVSRALQPKTVTSFGIGYAPESGDLLMKHLEEVGYTKQELFDFGLVIAKNNRYTDKFRGRVMFPIIDVRGNVIGFGGRILDDTKPKYLNSPETEVFNKRLNLYALNYAKNSKANNLILVEGFVDVISLHQAGIDNAVATLGTSLTPEQVQLIKRYTQEVIICYDTDEAGVKATLRAIELFSNSGVRVKVLSLTDAKDPDEFIKKHGGAEMFREALAKAVPATLYRIRLERKRFDVDNNVDDKVKFLQEAAKILISTRNPVEIDSYADMLAQEYNVKKESIFSEIKRLQGRERRSTESKQYTAPLKTVKITSDRTDGETVIKRNLPIDLAERKLLYLMFTNRQAAKKAETQIGCENFSNPLHCRLACVLCDMWNAGSTPSSAAVLSTFGGAEGKYITEILFDNSVFADTQAAADDVLIQVERIKLEEKIKQETDPEILQTLLLRKAGLDKKRGGAF